MNELVLKKYGFTALDPQTQCTVTAGSATTAVLKRLLQTVIGYMNPGTTVGLIVAMELMEHGDALIDGVSDGYNGR